MSEQSSNPGAEVVTAPGAAGSPEAPHGSPAPPPGKPARTSAGRRVLDLFLPNRAISAGTMRLLIAVEALIALAVWFSSPFPVLPRPDEVVRSLHDLWFQQGLGPELWASFRLNVEALGWSSLISLGLAYLTVLPVFRPIVLAVSKGRFLSLAGISLIFTLVTGGGHALKTWLLTFGISVFYVTAMASVVAQIPKAKFEHARTLRMSEWRVVWEVVILGTADQAFEVLRQNAAMGWMMITMVEGIVRSEGGVGAMLLAENKFFRMADVFAIQLVILLVGMFQDYAIGLIRGAVCPYADLVVEKN